MLVSNWSGERDNSWLSWSAKTCCITKIIIELIRSQNKNNEHEIHKFKSETFVPLLFHSNIVFVREMKTKKTNCTLHGEIDGRKAAAPNSSRRSIHHHFVYYSFCVFGAIFLPHAVLSFDAIILRKNSAGPMKNMRARHTGPDEIVL